MAEPMNLAIGTMISTGAILAGSQPVTDALSAGIGSEAIAG